MKKILQRVITICLMLAVLSCGVLTVQAFDEGVVYSLVLAVNVDKESQSMVAEEFAILGSLDGEDVVITSLEPRDDAMPVVRTMTDGKLTLLHLKGEWNGYYMYKVLSDLGKEQGCYPFGLVTQNEPIICFWYGYEGEDLKAYIYETTAEALSGASLQFAFDPPENILYPGMVLNSEGLVCAVITDHGTFVTKATEDSFYGGGQGNQPAQTQPPQEQPEEPQPTQPPAPEQPIPEQPNEQAEIQRKVAAMLPDLERIYAQAKIPPKKVNYTAIIAVAGVSLLVIALAVAVILQKKKNQNQTPTAPDGQLPEAEEGTQLADDSQDTGLWVKFRNGTQTPVRQSFSIGRAPDNGVVISQQSTSVSGHHCEIVVNNGKVYLRDVGSRNGTFINGTRIPVGQLIPLQPGMQVFLGGANGPECFVVLSGNR